MGGWISLIGDVPDLNERVNRFKRVFSIEGVPSLRTEIHSDTNYVKSVFWAWKEDSIPDVFIDTNNNVEITFSGVITDLGHFYPAPLSQERAVHKLSELWIEHGEEIINHINGSFSCLFFNREKKQASAFTDRFASRSVWFGKEDGIWIIGNFPSAITALMKNAPKLNPEGLWSLFHTGRRLGSQGIYASIKALLAGQKAVFYSDRKVEISHWWKRKYQPEYGVSPYTWGYRLANALNSSAVRYKKISKSPYLFLSGGLDSRIAAAAFRKPLRTLSLCTHPNAESRISSLVSRVIGLDHRTIIRSPYWYLDTTDASALISSGGYLNKHTHFIVPVKNVSSDNPKAEFLLGDLLENFNKHYFSFPAGQRFDFAPNHIQNLLFSCVPYTIEDVDRIGRHFNKKMKKNIEKRYIQSLKEYARSLNEVSEDPANRFDTLLRWADVALTPTYNMTTCIWPLAKERNLCFDNELNTLSLKIPSAMRGAGVLHKWILYHLCRRLLVIPDANTLLPPIIPKSVNQLVKKIRPSVGRFRRKLAKKRPDGLILKTSGSWLFLHEVYRKDKRYREQIESLILDKSIFHPEIFDLLEIKRTWKEYLAGNISLHFEIEALRSFGSLHKLIPCSDLDL